MAARAISPSLLCPSGPWYFAFVLGPPLLVGCPLVSVLCPDTRGESGSLLGLTSSVGLGRGRDKADRVGVCEEYPLQQRSVGSCHSLRWVMGLPRGVGTGLCVCQGSQGAQDPRKVWLVTGSPLIAGGKCSLWGRVCSGPLPSTSGCHAPVLCLQGGLQMAADSPLSGIL